MVRIHVPKPLAGFNTIQPFWFAFPDTKIPVLFDTNLPDSFFASGTEFVSADSAQAIVAPNNFTKLTPEVAAYLKTLADLGEKYHIPVFIFSLGDFTDALQFDPRVYVFRYSVYQSSITAQDIVMPTLTNDNGAGGIQLRPKSAVPTVSFCGQGGYNILKQQLKFYFKVAVGNLRALFNPKIKARIVGVYWRQKMLDACAHSSLVKTLFIVRRSFSGARRTIELDPTQARKEFVDSIVNSDFVLAPKGDGNYSNRFLEALSLGRIPVLLDTDTVLPLENEIAYEKVMVRVPMERVKDTPKYIRAWYDKLSEEDWKLAQIAARELYERALRTDSFFAYFFTTVVPQLPLRPAATSK